MKFKFILLVFAILGLVCVSSYLAYIYGMRTQRAGNILPIELSSAEKQIKSAKEKIVQKTAEKKAKKAEKKQLEEEKKTEKPPEKPAKDHPKKEETSAGSAEKKKRDEAKAGNNSDKDNKADKNDDKKDPQPSKPPLTNEELKTTLARYYKTGKLHEHLVVNQEKVDMRLQRYFIRGGMESLHHTKEWHEISLQGNGQEIKRKNKFSDLSKIPKDFSVPAVKKSYGADSPLKQKNYATLIEEIIKRPWYSRVYY